jgi:hypothetical protein
MPRSASSVTLCASQPPSSLQDLAAEEQRRAAQRHRQAQPLEAGQHQPEPGAYSMVKQRAIQLVRGL